MLVLVTQRLTFIIQQLDTLTCMINKMMGLDALYWLGSEPSKTPPCGEALTVEVGDADEVVELTVCEAIVAIAKDPRARENLWHCLDGRRALGIIYAVYIHVNVAKGVGTLQPPTSKNMQVT